MDEQVTATVRRAQRTAGRSPLHHRLHAALPLVLGAVAASLAMLAAEKDVVIPGLPDAGTLNEYLLRAARAATQLTAAGTVGTLLVLAALVPEAGLASDARRALRLGAMVRRWSVAWLCASTLLLVVTCAEAVGLPPGALLTGPLLDVVPVLPAARVLVPTLVVAFIVAVWAGSATTRVVAWPLLAFAIAALVPPLFNSHPGHSSDNGLALASLVAHVPAAALWVGGLMALVLGLRTAPAWLAVAVPRFSRLAGVCFLVVTASGVLAAYSRIPDLEAVWSTPYGRLALAKLAVLAVLGLCGALHRRSTVPAVTAGRPGSLLRLAVGELVLMASAFGLAAALATTAPPA